MSTHKLELTDRRGFDLEFRVDHDNDLAITMVSACDGDRDALAWLSVDEAKQLRDLLNQWLGAL